MSAAPENLLLIHEISSIPAHHHSQYRIQWKKMNKTDFWNEEQG
jgi:hypothetical protein